MNDGIIKAVTAREYEESQERSISIRPTELIQWYGKNMDRREWEDTKWTVLETSHHYFQPRLYKGLFSLITSHWKYHLALMK